MIKRAFSLIIVAIAVTIIAVNFWYFTSKDTFFATFSANPELYAGIVMGGAIGFAWVAIRVIVSKTESWYALLEGVALAGLICAAGIYHTGNLAGRFPGWCALLTSLGCFFLRFIRPRMK